MVHIEQIAKKNVIKLEEVLTLTFLFLSTSFSIDLKFYLKFRALQLMSGLQWNG